MTIRLEKIRNSPSALFVRISFISLIVFSSFRILGVRKIQVLANVPDGHFVAAENVKQTTDGEKRIQEQIIQDLDAHLLSPGMYLGPQISCNQSSSSIAENEVASEANVTAIFFMAARYCHPDISLFEAVWNSHQQRMMGFDKMKKVYLFDGFGDVGLTQGQGEGYLEKLRKAEDNKQNITEAKYINFQTAVQDFLRSKNQLPPQTTIVTMDRLVGPVESLNRILPTITTPIIYVAQDDFAIRINIDTPRVVRTMLNAARGYNNVRTVLLGWGNPGKKLFFAGSNAPPLANAAPLPAEVKETGWSQRASSFDPKSVCLDEAEQPRRVQFFCDHNHFALTELYQKYVLPVNKRNGDTFFELSHLHDAMNNSSLWGRYFGSHAYTSFRRHYPTAHLDGRSLKWCSKKS